MKNNRCGDCSKFLTDFCNYREDVDTSTKNCPCYEASDFCAECQIHNEETEAAE